MDIKVLFDDSAREGLYEGVKQITRAVASTLGPKGHTVIIDKGYGIPHVTKDGVTVARAFDTDDTVARMGATLVKMAAAKT
jgi:chaperonin GroEL